ACAMCWCTSSRRNTVLNEVTDGDGLRMLHFHGGPRLGLDHFHGGVALTDAVLEPLAGIVVAVAEQDCSGLDLTDEAEEIVTVGVSGQVEVFGFAAAGDLSRAGAEDKGVAQV